MTTKKNCGTWASGLSPSKIKTVRDRSGDSHNSLYNGPLPHATLDVWPRESWLGSMMKLKQWMTYCSQDIKPYCIAFRICQTEANKMTYQMIKVIYYIHHHCIKITVLLFQVNEVLHLGFVLIKLDLEVSLSHS